MSPPRAGRQAKAIRRQRRHLAKGLGGTGELLRASLLERFTVCGKPGCRCAKGHKHGPYLYVSFFDGKQSRQVYVPQSMETHVRAWVRNYHELAETVAKLSELSVNLIKLTHHKGKPKAKKHKPNTR